MKTNLNLEADLHDAINWESALSGSEIMIGSIDGVVTLTGTVNSYAKKLQAQEAVKSVNGVKVVIEKITIKFDSDMNPKNDHEIVKEVMTGLMWNWEVPNNKVFVTVIDGWVTLKGELEWNHQKIAANSAANNQPGVKGVTNNITLKSERHVEIEQKAIENALNRNWCIDKRDIIVKVLANHVILAGTVNSFYEKDEAERIARNAPGVWSVDNELIIEYH